MDCSTITRCIYGSGVVLDKVESIYPGWCFGGKYLLVKDSENKPQRFSLRILGMVLRRLHKKRPGIAPTF